MTREEGGGGDFPIKSRMLSIAQTLYLFYFSVRGQE